MVGPMGDEGLLSVGQPADDQGMTPEQAIQFVAEVASLAVALNKFIELAEELVPKARQLRIKRDPPPPTI